MINPKFPASIRPTFYMIATVLFVLNLMLLWMSFWGLPVGKKTLYLPFFVKYQFELQCLVFVAVIFVLAFWLFYMTGKEQIIHRRILAVVLVFTSILSAYFYFASILSQVIHLDTVQFKGNYYHLAEEYTFNEVSTVLLGECEQTAYSCNFHKIYRISTIYRIPEVRLDTSTENLLVTVNGRKVYSYDGAREECLDHKTGDSGFCVELNK